MKLITWTTIMYYKFISALCSVFLAPLPVAIVREKKSWYTYNQVDWTAPQSITVGTIRQRLNHSSLYIQMHSFFSLRDIYHTGACVNHVFIHVCFLLFIQLRCIHLINFFFFRIFFFVQVYRRLHGTALRVQGSGRFLSP